MGDALPEKETLEMAASKPLTEEKAEIENRMQNEGIISIILSAAKKVAIVGAVYFMGYMNWSIAWLICPLLMSVIRDQVKSKHDVRREVAKASATASDKEVILARLHDLPAWVRIILLKLNELFKKLLSKLLFGKIFFLLIESQNFRFVFFSPLGREIIFGFLSNFQVKDR